MKAEQSNENVFSMKMGLEGKPDPIQYHSKLKRNAGLKLDIRKSDQQDAKQYENVIKRRLRQLRFIQDSSKRCAAPHTFVKSFQQQQECDSDDNIKEMEHTLPMAIYSPAFQNLSRSHVQEPESDNSHPQDKSKLSKGVAQCKHSSSKVCIRCSQNLQKGILGGNLVRKSRQSSDHKIHSTSNPFFQNNLRVLSELPKEQYYKKLHILLKDQHLNKSKKPKLPQSSLKEEIKDYTTSPDITKNWARRNNSAFQSCRGSLKIQIDDNHRRHSTNTHAADLLKSCVIKNLQNISNFPIFGDKKESNLSTYLNLDIQRMNSVNQACKDRYQSSQNSHHQANNMIDHSCLKQKKLEYHVLDSNSPNIVGNKLPLLQPKKVSRKIFSDFKLYQAPCEDEKVHEVFYFQNKNINSSGIKQICLSGPITPSTSYHQGQKATSHTTQNSQNVLTQLKEKPNLEQIFTFKNRQQLKYSETKNSSHDQAEVKSAILRKQTMTQALLIKIKANEKSITKQYQDSEDLQAVSPWDSKRSSNRKSLKSQSSSQLDFDIQDFNSIHHNTTANNMPDISDTNSSSN